ncbi:MAG: biotin/lipoyl-containing protein, partial [Microcoleaceae cyanobacterium]
MSQTNPSTSSQGVETKVQSDVPNTFVTSEDLENSEISVNNHHNLIDTKQSDSNQLEQDFTPVKLLTIALVTLGIGFFGGQWWQADQIKSGQNAPKAETGPRKRSSLVEISPVKMALVQDTTEFVGTLQAEKVVDLRSESDGRVIEILVNSGDKLNIGQPIARLKVDDIEADWRRAQANLVQSRSRLAQLQAGSRPEEISAARARLNQEEANLARLKSGYRPEEITAAQARLNQAKANLAKLKTGNRPEEIAAAQAQLRKAEASLADAQTGSYIEEMAQAKSLIAVSQAELDLAEQQ